ncbi:MAG TPA: hypothetical protein VGE74_08620 [Gemmata sp.]
MGRKWDHVPFPPKPFTPPYVTVQREQSRRGLYARPGAVIRVGCGNNALPLLTVAEAEKLIALLALAVETANKQEGRGDEPAAA